MRTKYKNLENIKAGRWFFPGQASDMIQMFETEAGQIYYVPAQGNGRDAAPPEKADSGDIREELRRLGREYKVFCSSATEKVRADMETAPPVLRQRKTQTGKLRWASDRSRT